MTTIRYTIQRSSISFSELVERYGDLSLAEFVDLCIENGLIPLPPVFTSLEQMTLYPGNSVIFNVSGQNGLAS